MPDPIQNRFGYGQLWPLRLPASVSAPFPPPPPPPPQRHGSSCCAKPTRIRSGWPGQGSAKHIWSGLEANWCAGIIGPGSWQDATGPLSLSHFQTRFRFSTDVPDNIVQNQPGSDLVLDVYVRFWPNLSGPEASRCERIIRPASGQCFQADPDRMRIGSGMFAGRSPA